MKKLLIITAVFFYSGILHAQTYYAVGVLESTMGKPISGASVTIKSSGKVEITGESGNVVILASDKDSLQIQAKGYKERQIAMLNQPLAISIIMTAQPVAVATKPKKKKH